MGRGVVGAENEFGGEGGRFQKLPELPDAGGDAEGTDVAVKMFVAQGHFLPAFEIGFFVGKDAGATVGGNDGDAAFQGGDQAAGVIQGVGKGFQGVLGSGVAQERKTVVGQGVVKRETARMIGLDVLGAGQPFNEAGAAVDDPVEFAQGVVAIGVEAGAKEDFFVGGGEVGDEFVVGDEQGAVEIAGAILMVGGIEGEEDGAIDDAGINIIDDLPGDLTVGIGAVERPGREFVELHEPAVGVTAAKGGGEVIAAAFAAGAGEVDVEVVNHGAIRGMAFMVFMVGCDGCMIGPTSKCATMRLDFKSNTY